MIIGMTDEMAELSNFLSTLYQLSTVLNRLSSSLSGTKWASTIYRATVVWAHNYSRYTRLKSIDGNDTDPDDDDKRSTPSVDEFGESQNFANRLLRTGRQRKKLAARSKGSSSSRSSSNNSSSNSGRSTLAVAVAVAAAAGVPATAVQ